jgi:hypothetical protein
MSHVLVVLAAILALPTQAATQAGASKPAPMSVGVETSATGGPAVEDWAKELRAALGARKDEFRLLTPKEKPELVVRLDSVGKSRDGATPMLTGTLMLGAANRPFTYTFTNVHAEAEKLARNLRGVADKMKAGTAK